MKMTSQRLKLYVVFALVFIGILLIRISFVGIMPLWREDAFHYLDKAEEIIQGDFSIKEQDIGLSLFYAPFLKVFGTGNLFKDLRIAQYLLAIVEALIFLPLVLITLTLFRWKAALLASLLFAFWPGLIRWTVKGYSEGLFILCLLFAFYFLIISDKKKIFLLLSSGFVGLAFYVRVNGIFFIPVVLLFAYIYRKDIPEWNWRWPVLMVLVFLIVISPYFALRFSLYDNPLHYSMASKFMFSDNVEQLFDPEFQPTFSSYLASHSVRDMWNRAWGGLKTIVTDTYKASPFLLTMALLGLLIFRRKKYLSIHFVFLFWFIGLFWIYGVVRNSRFLLPLIVFAIIIAAGGAVFLFEKTAKPMLGLGLLFLFFVFIQGQPFFNARAGLKWEGAVWKDSLQWGEWIRDNIPQGKTLAIREGIDITDMMTSEINLVTIPNREKVDAIISYFKKEKVDYVALGTGGLEVADWNRIHALREIRNRSHAPFLIRVYSNEKLKWAMEIYKINWANKGIEYKRGPGDVVEAESISFDGISERDPAASNGFAVPVRVKDLDEGEVILGPIKGVPPGQYHVVIAMKKGLAGRSDIFAGF